MNTMATNKKRNGAANDFMVILALAVASLSCVSPKAHAQGSRKRNIAVGPTGYPVAGATATVRQPTAPEAPCTPLAIYTDATLTVASPNPFQPD
jgi:hypothetical protein